MTTYTCKTCGSMVAVKDGVIYRTCEHKDATVVAHLKAHATGKGGTKA